ncbi:MAG TPA: hypothetical protein PLE74_02010 [Candidatus Cloacimonadota bacterium]|nr:hypothetical protein [Candidatus Cloacimonadota bacterium]HPT71041.1 hypothetical protein [Candidatus Cloacimonadota bacterium]
MTWLKMRMISFTFLSIGIFSLHALTDNSINRTHSNNSSNREIGLAITPIFSMDTVDPSVTVISPNGGELWLENTQHEILWSAIDSHFVTNPINIMLSTDNGQNYSSLANDISNSGTYGWFIPDIMSLQSLIKIIATDSFGNTGYDTSNISFTLPGTTVSITPIFIIDTVKPVVNLVSPNGGETWNIGDINSITWESSDQHFGSTPITLEFFDGISWTMIQPRYANLGTYHWLVPDVMTGDAFVRVTATDAYGNAASDSSETAFLISSSIPSMVQNVRIEKIDEASIMLTWDPVTLTEQGYPITPSGYFVLVNSSNEPTNESSYYILGITETETSFFHEEALTNNPHMFYRIIAVKNSKSALKKIEKQINLSDPYAKKYTWNEIQNLMSQK